MRLDRHVTARQPGAARADHHVDLGVGAPGAQLVGDLGPFIAQDGARGQDMARLLDPPLQHVAGLVLVQPPRVRDREDGDTHGDEIPVGVQAMRRGGHGALAFRNKGQRQAGAGS